VHVCFLSQLGSDTLKTNVRKDVQHHTHREPNTLLCVPLVCNVWICQSNKTGTWRIAWEWRWCLTGLWQGCGSVHC
jgi:hypothetical protein